MAFSLNGMVSLSGITDVTNMSLRSLIIILFIILFTFFINRLIISAMRRYFKRESRSLKVDPTKYRFLRHLLTAAIYIAGFSLVIYMIPSLRTVAISLFAGAGILAVIVGFASQAAFANIVNGVFIVIFKPFRVGDRVAIGPDVTGVVEDITLRHTVIRTYEHRRVIIPNSVISNEKIENADLGDSKVCKFVDFGISYDSDVDLAKRIMQEEAQKHPKCIDNRTAAEKKEKKPKVRVRVLGMGDSSVNLRAWVWAKDASDAFVAGCDLYESIKKRFDEEGVEIPFPYRTVVMKQAKKKRS